MRGYVFYINLRRKSIIKYRDFIRVLFAIEEGGFLKKIKNIFTKVLKHVASTGEKATYKFTGIPVDKGLLETFFKEKSNEDVFNYLEEYFKNISKHKTPVLIIDELQVIGDLEINGKLIYKLFNFFIGLTKELHLCHVFALSSDSLFIEKVYSEAMLQGRARYLLVDDFDEATAKRFLKKYKFSDEEITLSLKYVGGKPGYLIEAVESKIVGKNIKEAISNILNTRKGEIKTTLNRVKQLGAHVIIGDDTHKIDYNLLNGTLNKFGERPYINTMEADEITKTYLAKQNILFVDPVFNVIKPQSKIDLLAIREILGELNTKNYSQSADFLHY